MACASIGRRWSAGVPEQPGGAAPTLALTATAFTHVGAVRARNEDTVAVDDWVMSQSMDQPMTLQRRVLAPIVCLVERAGEAADAGALVGLLRAVDEALFAAMRERPALHGMGSTVAGLHVGPAGLAIFNVGDSRVYRIEPSGLVQLSTDDTPGPKLDDGRTAAYTMALLTQSLGGWHDPEGIAPHVLSEPAPGRYLLCSDGLTDRLDPGAIADHIREDDGASVAALFEAAMAAGGDDNISIVLVRLQPA